MMMRAFDDRSMNTRSTVTGSSTLPTATEGWRFRCGVCLVWGCS